MTNASSGFLSSRRFAAWSAALADVLARDSDENTLRALADSLGELASVDTASSYALRAHSGPLTLFDELPPGTEPVRYTDSPYLLDPVYIAFLRDELPLCCHTLDDVCPDGFRESDYYRHYWTPLQITDEFSFNVPCGDDTLLHCSLLRRGSSPPFSEAELLRFRAVAPIVAQTMLRFWQLRGDEYASGQSRSDEFHGHLSYALANFGKSLLTGREREVVHLMLRGYSDKLAARELGITPGTVRNHKKSIFGKLGVSSQGQVFALLLDVLRNPMPDGPGADPLAVLMHRRTRE